MDFRLSFVSSTVELPDLQCAQATPSRLGGSLTDFREMIYHESCSHHAGNDSQVGAFDLVHIPRNDCRYWTMVVLGLASLPIGGISRPPAGA